MRFGIPSFDHPHDDFYERQSYRSRAQRTAEGRCVGCDAFVVDGYFCYDCGIDSDYNVPDRSGPTATMVGRSQRRRVDAGAEYDQLISMQTAVDHDVDSGDHEVNGSSKRLRRLRWANAAMPFTPAEHRRINAVIGAPVLVTPWGDRKDVGLADRRRMRKIRRQAPAMFVDHRDVRVEWGAFCMGWDLVAWEALDAATAPDVTAAA